MASDPNSGSDSGPTQLWQPGDLVFVRNPDLFGRVIRLAQRYDRDGPDSEWNHVAVLDRPVGNTWLVVQAESRGVTDDKSLVTLAPGGKYEIVRLPATADRADFLAACRSKIGQKYGWLTILSCAIGAFFPRWPQFRRPNTSICSGLVATSLHFAGYGPVSPLDGLQWVTPAQVLKAVRGA